MTTNKNGKKRSGNATMLNQLQWVIFCAYTDKQIYTNIMYIFLQFKIYLGIQCLAAPSVVRTLICYAPLEKITMRVITPIPYARALARGRSSEHVNWYNSEDY